MTEGKEKRPTFGGAAEADQRKKDNPGPGEVGYEGEGAARYIMVSEDQFQILKTGQGSKLTNLMEQLGLRFNSGPANLVIKGGDKVRVVKISTSSGDFGTLVEDK